jgi:hypothetical protein
MATVTVWIDGVQRTIAERRKVQRSDTPRTDNEARWDPFYPGRQFVDADFARALERDLIEARKALALRK